MDARRSATRASKALAFFRRGPYVVLTTCCPSSLGFENRLLIMSSKGSIIETVTVDTARPIDLTAKESPTSAPEEGESFMIR